MANINDSAGIFVGTTLDAFNVMQTLVQRDGDVVGAQAVTLEELRKLIATKRTDTSGSGSTTVRRN